MNKFWIVYSRSFFGQVSKEFKTSQDAAKYASELKAKSGKDYFVMETVGFTGQPPPQIDMVKVKEDAMAPKE